MITRMHRQGKSSKKKKLFGFRKGFDKTGINSDSFTSTSTLVSIQL